MAFLLDHQRDALKRLIQLDGKAGLWMRMRTGKTRVALAYTSLAQCQRVLVVAPISAIPSWETEWEIVRRNLKQPTCLKLIDLSTGSIQKRADTLKATRHPAVVLVNYESYWREPFRSRIAKWEPDAVILDEGHRVRHRGARQSRFAHVLANKPHVRVRLSLSGTPITNGLQDAWSVYRFIDPPLFGTWAQFEGHYMLKGGYMGRQIVGYQNETEARDRIASRAFQWEGTFPEPTDVPVLVRLDAKTRKVYDELRKKAIVELQDAQGKPRTVVASIVLTLLLRLQQITCGFTVDVDGNLVEVSDEKARVAIDKTSDAIAGHEKVVIFCRFLHDLDLLERLAPKDWRLARIDGSRTSAQRREIITNLHAGELDVIIAQTKTASLGVDFTPASVGIFFSAGFSLDEFIQAKARMDGYNQAKPVAFYHLLTERTIDLEIYRALQAKTQIAQRVTDLSYAFSLFGVQP